MNVAMVSEHASPLATLGGADSGGQNVHVADLSAALVRAGHRVRVFTRRDAADLPSSVTMPTGVVVEHVTAGPADAVPKDDLWPFMGEFARELTARMAADVPDLVHAHFWMSGSVACAAGARLAIPVVLTFHALGSEKRRMQGRADTSPPIRCTEEVRIIGAVDRIVATSTREMFELSRLGADPRRLRVIPCGVDLRAFDAASAPFAWRRRYANRIATLSRLVDRKGVADVIAALADLPDTELLIAGGPAPRALSTDSDVRRLSRVAAECGVADRVRFVGRLDRHEIPAFLGSADAVVCAGWYEPFGIVPLEAMAAARPVVATAVGGQNDTILDGVTGIHVPPRDPRAIARALRDLLAEPERGDALGAAGRQRVAQRYTWDRVAGETLSVYRGVAREASGEATVTA